MSAHTPGPWEFDAWGDIRAGHDTVICGMGKSCGLKGEYALEPKPVMLANARLIAAAPETAAERDRLKEVNAELLAALKEVIDTSQASPSEWVRACSMAAAAIAKATGEAS